MTVIFLNALQTFIFIVISCLLFSIHSLIRIASYAMTLKSHTTVKLYWRCRRLTATPVWLFICTPNRRGPEERRHRRIRITSVPARASVSTLAFASFHGSKSVHAPHRPQSAGRGFNPGPAPVDDLMPSLKAHSIRAHTVRPKLKSPSKDYIL